MLPTFKPGASVPHGLGHAHMASQLHLLVSPVPLLQAPPHLPSVAMLPTFKPGASVAHGLGHAHMASQLHLLVSHVPLLQAPPHLPRCRQHYQSPLYRGYRNPHTCPVVAMLPTFKPGASVPHGLGHAHMAGQLHLLVSPVPLLQAPPHLPSCGNGTHI